MRKGLFVLFLILLAQCNGPEARKPVKVKSGSFIKESVERNRELLAQEEELIRSIIDSDTLKLYQSTDFGAWYSYNTKVQEDTYRPVENDQVTIRYDMLSLANDTIYKSEEMGDINFIVDKESLFPGLRNGIKLLKEGETATFLFPSHLVYGYHGDNDKIGPNVPVKSTITLLKIEQSRDSILK